MLLAQLSDAHLQAGGDDGASAAALVAAVREIRALRPAPDALLVSGDLADQGSDAEYARAGELLEPLEMPIVVMAGNHDERRALQARFPPPAPHGPGEYLQFALHVGEVRLVVCDTKIPGTDAGGLGPERLSWLSDELAAAPREPTIVAMHHPPFLTGIGPMDELALAASDREVVAELMRANPQVQRIVAGHVHRAITGSAGGCPVFVCPGSHLQIVMVPGVREPVERIEPIEAPPAIGLHSWTTEGLASHVHPIRETRASPAPAEVR